MNQNQNSQGMPSFSQGQVDMLLNMASSRLGVKPEELKRQLQSGQLPSGVDQGSLSQFLGDQKKLESLLSSKATQQLLQGLMNNKGGK